MRSFALDVFVRNTRAFAPKTHYDVSKIIVKHTTRRGTIGWLLIAASILYCGALTQARAQHYVPFRPDLPVGTKCLIDPAVVHPTQTAVGMREVQMRMERMKAWSVKKRERFMKEKTAPIVIGPGNEVYLLDHHHLARLLLESKMLPAMYAEIKGNYSALSERDFWAAMKEHKWVYLFDEAGRPLDAPSHLPKRIMDLRDDPYRSLSWLVREQNGYREVDAPYLEFEWANFFRSRVTIEPGKEGCERAVPAALLVCHSPEAKQLPGYIAR